MKAFVLAVLLAISAMAFEQDKVKHFAGSMAIAAVGSGLAKHYGSSPLEAWFIGFGSSIIVGIAKERIDGGGYGSEDIHDVYADTLGASLGATLFSWEF